MSINVLQSYNVNTVHANREGPHRLDHCLEQMLQWDSQTLEDQKSPDNVEVLVKSMKTVVDAIVLLALLLGLGNLDGGHGARV